MNRKPPVQMSDDIVEALRLFAIWLERGVYPQGFDFKAWIGAYGPRMLVLDALKTLEGLRSFAKKQGDIAIQFEDELHKANVRIKELTLTSDKIVAVGLQHSPETLLDSEGHQQGECDEENATRDGQSTEPGNPPGSSG